MTMARPAETDSEDSWTFLLRAWQETDVPEGFRAEIREEGIVLVPPPGGPHNLMADTVTHFSNPREGEYDTSRRTTFGEDVLLPKPVELKIVTSEFE